MKNWIIFIAFAILNCGRTFACGFYPFAEELRFSLLKPRYTSVKGWDPFQYTSQLYNYSLPHTFADSVSVDENTAWWHEVTGKKVPADVIFRALYHMRSAQIENASSANAFVRVLHRPEYKEYLSYLLFAKHCSSLNTQFSDPWERGEYFNKHLRDKQIGQALRRAEKAVDKRVKRRYAYLAIRMAFYSGNYSTITKLYHRHFEDNDQPDITYYWALHFYSFTLKKSARKNVEVARVFAHSAEKRFAVQFQFDRDISLSATLAAASTDDEKAAVHLMWAARQTDRAFEQIKAYHRFAPNGTGLEFLVLREVNKLEDWIFTPHYGMFPSMAIPEGTYEDTRSILEQRVNRDRRYAGELTRWMRSVNNSAVKDRHLWQLLGDYLQFMSGQTDGLRTTIASHIAGIKTDELAQFGRQLESLVIAHEDHTLSNPRLQKTLMDEDAKFNNRFLFAVGRELEFNGNTSEAAMLFSHLNKPTTREEEESFYLEDYFSNDCYWRSPKLIHTLWEDIYSDYFLYMDAQYTPQQIRSLISSVKTADKPGKFERWKLSMLEKDLSRLYDLLGTKYVRKDQIAQAAWAFKQVNDTLWTSKNYPYHEYLGANPFYTNFYTEHRRTKADTIRYTKFEIMQQLLRYKRLALSSKGNKKAWYTMQVANCYLNMTHYGNSWMIRRYYWTSSTRLTGLEDDLEFNQCHKAKNYYLQASRAATDRGTKAMMLRMAGRCEEYRMLDEHSNQDDVFRIGKGRYQNKLYKQLRQQYPEHAEELLSNCYSFDEYYRKMTRR